MTEARELAAAAVAASSYSAAVDRIQAASKQRLLELIDALGASKLELIVTGPDDTVLGTVSLRAGRINVAVTDEAAFIRWVGTRYPTEVTTVTTVRPAFRSKLIEHAKKIGEAVDPDSGEVVPGVQVSFGDPHLAVTPTSNAHKLADELVQTGRPPQLPGRPASDTGGNPTGIATDPTPGP